MKCVGEKQWLSLKTFMKRYRKTMIPSKDFENQISLWKKVCFLDYIHKQNQISWEDLVWNVHAICETVTLAWYPALFQDKDTTCTFSKLSLLVQT